MKYIYILLKFAVVSIILQKTMKPPENDFLDIDTTNISVDECISKILKEFVK